MNDLRTAHQHAHAPIEIFKHNAIVAGHPNMAANLHPMHGQHAPESHILA